MSAIEPRLEDEDDPAVHLLWRMVGDYSLQALNPDLLYLSREAAYDDPETTRAVARTPTSTCSRGPRGTSRACARVPTTHRSPTSS